MAQPLKNMTKKKHRFDPSVLREYDIRGIVEQTINENDAYAVGRSFGTIVKQKKGFVVTVGFDGRHSSPLLATQVQEGLKDCGIEVLNLGLCPSPLTYFSTYYLGVDASIMVTGSHNPPEYNGFKFMLQGKAFFGEDIQKMGQISQSASYAKGQGTINSKNIKQAYVERLAQDLSSQTPLKIAWDLGHGATASVIHDLVKLIPGEHVLLFDKVDGDFPAHHPDPTIEDNLQDLIQTVKEHDCAVGFAFDGDGDRIGIVDEQGSILWADQLMAILITDILKKYPGAPIIADVKCSQTLFEEIERLGGNPIMWKTGHSLVKAKMAEEESPLAGELSGHIFYGDGFYGYDDALYVSIRLLSIMGAQKKKLSELTAHLPKMINTPEIRFEVEEEKKFLYIQQVKERLSSNPSYQVNAIDGLRVQTEDGWWLLRASNTQNALSARIESDSQAGLEKLKALLCEQLTLCGIKPPPFIAKI